MNLKYFFKCKPLVYRCKPPVYSGLQWITVVKKMSDLYKGKNFEKKRVLLPQCPAQL